eukprot:CAMPEP_0194539274 /NCGR_PEP_ID=MMETSP0253-20130528/79179_1 /TAXON_ID=2966 /ORGANISM="Noctiluca scintillans" /LENGTH=60 /DNA_ID=CAMNT_0039385533 /DNA_START=58 /DNA_END=241 /DNA_ORIENTATION=+
MQSRSDQDKKRVSEQETEGRVRPLCHQTILRRAMNQLDDAGTPAPATFRPLPERNRHLAT